ncbi:DUF6538 domain-containing protein [Novosphingobium sp. FSW06-99]|uniref:DUF6538 domain-containing protein n=1 Tax=Novosphingobium sp. FSW06-99 TaxID=1739113 RepID=UPI0035144073
MRGSVYQFRVKVPVDLREAMGCIHVSQSLRTDSNIFATTSPGHCGTKFAGCGQNGEELRVIILGTSQFRDPYETDNIPPGTAWLRSWWWLPLRLLPWFVSKTYKYNHAQDATADDPICPHCGRSCRRYPARLRASAGVSVGGQGIRCRATQGQAGAAQGGS